MPSNNLKGHINTVSTVNPITINYVDAPAGSGKTYTAVRIIDEFASKGGKIIYAAPTTDLIDEVYDQFLELSNNAYERHKTHGKEVKQWEAVGSSAANWIKENSLQNQGSLIVLSHSALMQLISKRLVDDLSMWHLVVDEEFAGGVTSSGSFHVSTADILTNLFDENSFVNGFDIDADLQIKMHQESLVKSISNGKCILQDYKTSVCRSLCESVLDPLLQVNGELIKTKLGCELKYVTYLKPDFLADFASLKLMSADLTDSLLYRLWLKDGVQFKRWKKWYEAKDQESSRLQPSGKHLTVYYLLKKNNEWRTYFLQTVGKHSKKRTYFVIEYILSRILHYPLKVTSKVGRFKYLTVEPLLRVNKKFLEYLESDGRTLREANNWEITQYKKERGIGESISINFDIGSNTINEYKPLPSNAAGLNAFKGSHKVVYLQTSMPTDYHAKWLKFKGRLADNDLRRSYYLAPMYQSVMRSSLRDPDNTEPKTVIVGDQHAAKYLLERLPGAKLHHLPIDILEEAIASKEPRATRSDSGSGLTRSENDSLSKVTNWLKKFDIQLEADHRGSLFKGKHNRNLSLYLADIAKIYELNLTDAAIKEYDYLDKDINTEGKGRRLAAKKIRDLING